MWDGVLAREQSRERSFPPHTVHVLGCVQRPRCRVSLCARVSFQSISCRERRDPAAQGYGPRYTSTGGLDTFEGHDVCLVLDVLLL